MNMISYNDLRVHMSEYARRVMLGDSFTVVQKSRPLFTIAPVKKKERWRTVVNFTKIRPGGIPAEQALKALRKLNASRRG